MRKTIPLLIVGGILALTRIGTAQPTTKPSSNAAVKQASPAPAAQLLATARKRARKENKTVLVMFHASWCGWCERLLDVMDKPEFKKLFNDNYVVVTLDVSESDAKKILENPGADKLMATLGGALSGLPFYAFLDAKGKKLMDSNRVAGANGTLANIGYPAAPAEIAAFDDLLQKTAPRMNPTARKNLRSYLTQNSKHE